jgi:hypothetical protein
MVTSCPLHVMFDMSVMTVPLCSSPFPSQIGFLLSDGPEIWRRRISETAGLWLLLVSPAPVATQGFLSKLHDGPARLGPKSLSYQSAAEDLCGGLNPASDVLSGRHGLWHGVTRPQLH